MGLAIPAWETPSLPIIGTTDRFPVRRIFCVGRNYVEHQKEMGGDGKEPPFFFMGLLQSEWVILSHFRSLGACK